MSGFYPNENKKHTQKLATDSVSAHRSVGDRGRPISALIRCRPGDLDLDLGPLVVGSEVTGAGERDLRFVSGMDSV